MDIYFKMSCRNYLLKGYLVLYYLPMNIFSFFSACLFWFSASVHHLQTAAGRHRPQYKRALFSSFIRGRRFHLPLPNLLTSFRTVSSVFFYLSSHPPHFQPKRSVSHIIVVPLHAVVVSV